MNASIEKLRKDFPIFAVKPESAYLDNAVTSQVPQTVLDAMGEYHCAYRAAVHKGLYKESIRATEVYEASRAKVAKFLHAGKPDDVVFTAGATVTSNMLTYALERTLHFKEGDEIVTTVMEHHASLIPLQQLAKRKKLVLKHIPLGGADFGLDYAAAEKLITRRTKLVSVMLASNVLGTINDIARIAERAHAVGALMISDATAAIGHVPFDLKRSGADFIFFSGHKMCGPTGVGVLAGAPGKLDVLQPGFFGGGMVDDVTLKRATWIKSSQRFEPGTPNIAGAIGLGAAVDYLERNNMQAVRRYIEALVRVMQEQLRTLPSVTLYTADPAHNIGIVSFVVQGIHPHDIAEIAARNDVALRAGHHCALPLHKELGLTATVRASLYLYNTKRDIDALVESVQQAQKVFLR